MGKEVVTAVGDGTAGRRFAVVLWSALAVEVVGLSGAFALADTTVLVPEYEGTFAKECAVLLGLALAVLPVVVAVLALRLPRNTTALWRAAASWILALALLIVLGAAGSGPWVGWCVVAMVASCVATVICADHRADLPSGPSRVVAAVALAALVVAACGSCAGPYTDYPGVWTAPHDAASLTLTEETQPGRGGQYTLRIGTCTERGKWVFDYPQMSTSVQMWLHGDNVNACLPGRPDVQIRIVGGDRRAPVIALYGLHLTKQ